MVQMPEEARSIRSLCVIYSAAVQFIYALKRNFNIQIYRM